MEEDHNDYPRSGLMSREGDTSKPSADLERSTFRSTRSKLLESTANIHPITS